MGWIQSCGPPYLRSRSGLTFPARLDTLLLLPFFVTFLRAMTKSPYRRSWQTVLEMEYRDGCAVFCAGCQGVVLLRRCATRIRRGNKRLQMNAKITKIMPASVIPEPWSGDRPTRLSINFMTHS